MEQGSETPMKKSSLAIAGMLLMVSLALISPLAFATTTQDLQLQTTPTKAPVGGSVTFNIEFAPGSLVESAAWIAVIAPSGTIYVLGGGNSPSPIATFTGNSGASTPYTSCDVQFGASGALAVVNSGNTATVSGCSGSNNWYVASGSYSTIQGDCPSGGPIANPATSGSASAGSIGSAGTYSAIVCYSEGTTVGSLTGAFSADTSFSTPQFGLALGFGAVVAIGLVGMLALRKRSLGPLTKPAA